MVKPDKQLGEIPKSKEAYEQTLKIATPAVAEMVSMALLAMVDMIMVAGLGSAAIAAVGLTAQPRMIFFAVFFAMNVAATAIIARYKGTGDKDAARSCLRHSILIGLFAGLLMTFLAIVLARPMMMLAGATDTTLDLSASYFRIAGFGIVFAALSQIICSAQRATGNTKITMKVNMTANVVKVAANFLLIPILGVDGAAVSLVITNVLAFILAAISLVPKDSYLRIAITDKWNINKQMLKTIGRQTSGGMIEQLALRIGFFLYARVVADLGDFQVAVHHIAMQLMNLSFTFADGIAIATTSLVGQNLGKKRADLSRMFGQIGLRLAFIVAVCLSILVIIFRFQFPAMFATGDDAAAIIEATAGIMIILAIILPFQTTQLVMGGSLRGAGDTRYVAVTMLLTVGFIRPLTGYLFAFELGLGLAGAWFAIIVDQIARLVLLYVRFIRGKWTTVKI